ncbi:hypothetical protein [Enterococcus thailandicus]|uniref:hypothetical protein n=1 Tax=Enterococcus thailandicus TaxID=417368 RepID=UPI0022E26518|nr:hypothetical protein [Enterococcus thailandicus]MDK4352950.1 hypothetical protein [Enterococcus thailandicus]MDT2734216.1 hypothetical protein [Enterococcus thailandicus]MDT2793215.1 hypothetical protein [Enterococcus thailandicus]
MQIRKPLAKHSSDKLFLAMLTKGKHPIYRVRQLQALCYISLILNIILLSVILAIL